MLIQSSGTAAIALLRPSLRMSEVLIGLDDCGGERRFTSLRYLVKVCTHLTAEVLAVAKGGRLRALEGVSFGR